MNPIDGTERSFLRELVAWLGLALLSVSWLPGLGYYRVADATTWMVLVGCGWICLTAVPGMELRPRARLVAGVLSLPAMVLAPWPYRAGVLTFALGCLLPTGCFRRVPGVGGLLQRLCSSAPTVGIVLLIQALTVNAYAVLTSRSHDLPVLLSRLLGGVTSLLGVESAVHDQTLALHSMRKIHLLGTTFELMLDPATIGFVVAGIAVLWLSRPAWVREARSIEFVRTCVSLAAVILLWLPLRAGLLIALYLQIVLRTPFEAELDAMRLFWDSWVHLLMLSGPILIFTLWGPRLYRPFLESKSATSLAPFAWRTQGMPLLCAAAGSLAITIGLFWDPVGTRLAGRVVVEEHHPDPARIWEPTGRAYDTNWYGQASGYNYACIYDYCSRYYTMSRWTQPITSEALRDCDVLILKVPTRPYSKSEVEQVLAFVEDGGGLLLIGEHTNVYRTSDYLNPIAARFGFEFRADCLFGIDSVFEQAFRPPLVSHPIVQRIATMDFATSCSIAPGLTSGRAPIRSVALKNKLADYHADNYYPQPSDDAAMRYGAFVQLWTTRYGKGRVVAFTDSTIFSNFCVFEPGKSELMLGMIEWLNHRGGLSTSRPILGFVGLVLAAVSATLGHRRSVSSASLVAAALLGWSLGIVVVQVVHHQQMPPTRQVKDFVDVALDRTLCDGPLSKNGFVDASGEGFGVFTQWILRMGYFTKRREGNAVFDADLVLLIAPNRAPGADYLDDLDEYLRTGGTVAIIDHPRERSTTNELLKRYGLAVNQDARLSGSFTGLADWPATNVDQAVAVEGGEPFAWIQGQAVGSRVRRGSGTLVVIGFGSRFRDANMGHGIDVEPDTTLEQVFQLEYTLLRWMVDQEAGGP